METDLLFFSSFVGIVTEAYFSMRLGHYNWLIVTDTLFSREVGAL